MPQFVADSWLEGGGAGSDAVWSGFVCVAGKAAGETTSRTRMFIDEPSAVFSDSLLADPTLQMKERIGSQ